MFESFEQAFPQSSGENPTASPAKSLRRRKSLREKLAFWGINLNLMPLVAVCYFTIGAEGLRQTMGIFSMRLYNLPIPGAGLLQNYDGWNRLDLSMLMAFVLFGAVTFLWYRLFSELQSGNLAEQRTRNPALFYLLASIGAIVVLGDSALFFIGLESQASSSWGETSQWVPLGATIVYMAGLSLVGAYHADFHNSGYV